VYKTGKPLCQNKMNTFTHSAASLRLVTETDIQTLRHCPIVNTVKRFSHTHCRALPSIGPEADPGVHSQVTKPVVGCHYFLPGTWCSFHQMAPHSSTHPFQVYYSFIYPQRMKGWVGWPVADGLTTIVVTHQLQVEHRTGKVCRPETDVLPLCNATS